MVQRAKIILLAFKKQNNEQIAEVVGLNPQAVSVWRKRWKAKLEELIQIECTESKLKLKQAIKAVLSDLPRAGCKRTFTTEQQAEIVAIACETPEKEADRPMLHGTRCDEDFLRNIQNLVRLDPTAQWRFVADNLNTHMSECLSRFDAEQCDLKIDLGSKKKPQGILRSLKSRREFLSDPTHWKRASEFSRTKNPKCRTDLHLDRLAHCRRLCASRSILRHCLFDEALWQTVWTTRHTADDFNRNAF